MTEEIQAGVTPASTPAQDAPATTPQGASGAGGIQIEQMSESEIQATLTRLQARLQEVNRESAGRRHENKELTGQLSTMQESLQAIRAELQAEKDRRAQAEQAADKAKTAAERQALVSEIAGKFGLSPKLAARLAGDTREALEADAAELAGELGQRLAATAGGRAGNSAWQGGLTLDQIAQMTPAEIAARMDEVDAALKQSK